MNSCQVQCLEVEVFPNFMSYFLHLRMGEGEARIARGIEEQFFKSDSYSSKYSALRNYMQ